MEVEYKVCVFTVNHSNDNIIGIKFQKSEIQQADNSELAEHQKTWGSFSRIMDRVMFLLYLATYVIFFAMYIPLKYASRFGEYELHVLDYKDINHF